MPSGRDSFRRNRVAPFVIILYHPCASATSSVPVDPAVPDALTFDVRTGNLPIERLCTAPFRRMAFPGAVNLVKKVNR